MLHLILAALVIVIAANVAGVVLNCRDGDALAKRLEGSKPTPDGALKQAY